MSKRTNFPKKPKPKKTTTGSSGNKTTTFKLLTIDTIIESSFREKTQHRKSYKLTKNPYNETKDYNDKKTRINEYKIQWSQIEKYNTAHPNLKKSDLIDPKDPNIGWKIHLNVKPENAKEVARYLKQNGYVHKYLSGGEIENGKIFTIYIGSLNLVQKLSKTLSQDLEYLLTKPKDKGEIEFEAGIIGRFVVESGTEFHKYGSVGFSLLKEDWDKITNLRFQNLIPEELKKERIKLIKNAEIKAFLKLRKQYGDYFFRK
jgi:hypothetical protein